MDRKTAASILGRLGGRKAAENASGKHLCALTKEQQSERGKQAAAKRWANLKPVISSELRKDLGARTKPTPLWKLKLACGHIVLRPVRSNTPPNRAKCPRCEVAED